MVLRDVIVVGAGPAGLATAIAASKSKLSCQVIEKGALVNSLLHYPTEMVFFTTPELMEIGGMPFVSPYDKPTRLEALRYYRRVSDAFKLDIVFDEAVVAVSRDACRPTGRPTAPGRSSSTRIRHAACAGRFTDERSSSPLARTTFPIASASRARICRTSRTTTRSRTVLPEEGGDRRREELLGRGRARPLSSRRAGHDRAPRRRRWEIPSSTGSSPTSTTASRKARSVRASTRTSSRSARRAWSSSAKA